MGSKLEITVAGGYKVFNTRTAVYVDFPTNMAIMRKRSGGLKEVSLSDLPAYIDSYHSILMKRHFKDKRWKKTRYLVFINDLTSLLDGIMKDMDGKRIGSKIRPNGTKPEIIYFVTKKVVYANFNVITNNSPDYYSDMFNSESRVDAMYSTLDILTQGDWSKAQWSLASISRSMFYEPIKDHLAQYMTKERELAGYFPDVYDDMLLGNKAGILRKFDDETDPIIRTPLIDVDSYDKKSAYPSILVNDSLFPVGKIVKVGCKNWSHIDTIRYILARLQKNDKQSRGIRWIKICTEKGVKLETEWSSLFYDSDEDRYAFEVYDLLFYLDQGINAIWDLLNEIMNHKFTLYTSEETGYLDRVFRDRVVQMYNEKNREDISREMKFLLKTQLDMLNGKSIQEKHYSSMTSLLIDLGGNGSRYLRPQHGMHCIAAVRYEILTLLLRHQLIAYDTDGIKLYDGRPNKRTDFMHFYNLVIEDKNRLAGYDGCDIGKWKHEYRANIFIQIGTKQYIYIIGNQMEIKAAGIPKSSIRAAIRRENITSKDKFISYIRKNKLICYVDQLGYSEEDQLYFIDQKAVEF